EPGDGGGDSVYWAPGEDKQNHNGGTIFSPTWNNGSFGDTQDANWYEPDPNDNGTGCLVRRGKEDRVSVLDFAASSAISYNAHILEAIDKVGPIEVEIPKGEVIDLSSCTLNSRVSLVGEGTLRWVNPDGDWFTFNDMTDITIKGV